MNQEKLIKFTLRQLERERKKPLRVKKSFLNHFYEFFKMKMQKTIKVD